MKVDRQRSLIADIRWIVGEDGEDTRHYTAIWICMPVHTDGIEIRIVDTQDGYRVAWDCKEVLKSTLQEGAWRRIRLSEEVPVALFVPGIELTRMSVEDFIDKVAQFFASLGVVEIYTMAVERGLWDKLKEWNE